MTEGINTLRTAETHPKILKTRILYIIKGFAEKAYFLMNVSYLILINYKVC